MANPKKLAKDMAISVVAGIIVGALVTAGNYSGVAATLAGLLTTVLFATVLIAGFE